MNPRILANLRGFLARTQLSGAEVPAYVEIQRWLEQIEAESSADDDVKRPASDT